MVCAHDIEQFNSIQQEDRVYTFLDGLDDRLDSVRADVLQLQPLPTVEQAYALVRKEDFRRSVMLAHAGVDLIARRGGRRDVTNRAWDAGSRAGARRETGKIGDGLTGTNTYGPNGDGPTRDGLGAENAYGLVMGPGQYGPNRDGLRLDQSGPSKKYPRDYRQPKTQIGCTHCNNSKHTCDTCFKLHGYPDWWESFKNKKHNDKSNRTGRAALMNTKSTLTAKPMVDSPNLLFEGLSTLSDSGNYATALLSTNHNDCSDWIVDSGTTNHMTYDEEDQIIIFISKRSCIANANGVTCPVTGAGTVVVSSSLSLSNTLVVPSLSNKVLSVGQVTEELNCCVLMYLTFCIFQGILIKEIIGRGTKRGRLYFVDYMSVGKANSMQGTSDT